MSKRVLVVSVHPDDETLGAGGTLLKHKANGDSIHCVFCTDIFEEEGFAKEKVIKRKQEIQQVSQAYNFDTIHHLGLKTMRVDEYSKSFLISKFSHIFNILQPQIIYLPFAYDAHSDHRIIFEAAFACTKSFRYGSIEQILMMEIISESEFASSLTPFTPNVFVDITDFIEQKCKIMEIYESELSHPPFPRSIENIKALALYRGSTMGGKDKSRPLYSESFMLLKMRIQ